MSISLNIIFKFAVFEDENGLVVISFKVKLHFTAKIASIIPDLFLSFIIFSYLFFVTEIYRDDLSFPFEISNLNSMFIGLPSFKAKHTFSKMFSKLRI